ncbi:DivIVA domain-containing protein [Staphylococcus saprophyticus]|jgi:cell division initiation protein|uniref:Putative cell-division initiation protein n=1 Tax=Staphylococcus saprophyticus subsp. saprophyticus (strain ATCC 15305 / DSM 20229 / NCIMB 8711 / NCTC 7292 / S-41) TaxID=342451 RepID=Q49WX4_STAS1|nr:MULTISPECIES: DivIVA domain-containing protein [Staphylococcus]AMG20664.1 DivIVA domain-containing protein [Staphylococcus saprophyticus]AMG33775.1 DivIVA domain-containing protein [Staphylococcus saprophyticus]ASF18402.1 DivIVA domain-containing protein [Staphylococcus saprophyticus]MBC2921117.1 DivIVA domain-containing protein [Staphylococcus saprophyticus]MBC2956822.1 DivIVA domain-containing protein [Staphylococcus saprophyticus]
MPFTPSEIKNKTFTQVKSGFEPKEVEDYLEQLSNEIERLKEDKAQLEKVIEDKETNIQSYKDVHQSVSDALIQAKHAGEETKAAATKEAEATVAKAKAEADKIVNDGVEKARRLSFQTEDMKRQSKIFRSRFRMLVEAQLDLLKSEDWDYLLNYDLDSEQVTQENINHLNEKDLTEEEKAMKAKAEADNTAQSNDDPNKA